MTPTPTFAFGPYVFIPSRQLLMNSGRAVRVGGRALDLLAAFVRRPGELLSKHELLDEAWPSTTVVEGNLKVHIAALRRALEDNADAPTWIATINGRGYRFIAPVETGQTLATPLNGERGPHGVESVQRPSTTPVSAGFDEAVALLASAMRSSVIDLAHDVVGEGERPAPRRVLFIELTASNEALIENVFAQHLRTISATR